MPIDYYEVDRLLTYLKNKEQTKEKGSIKISIPKLKELIEAMEQLKHVEKQHASGMENLI